MSLGIIEECLKLSIDYAKHRRLWGTAIATINSSTQTRADGSGARERSQHGVAHIERSSHGAVPSFAEASAMKLYSAQAAARWPTTRFRFLVQRLHRRVPGRATQS